MFDVLCNLLQLTTPLLKPGELSWYSDGLQAGWHNSWQGQMSFSSSAGHIVGGIYFVRPDILMISSKNHCSLMVACWDYHCNGGNKFITVSAYTTDKEL
jgi:hypothetical protein